MCYSHRRLYAQLAEALIMQGEDNKALQVLDKCEKGISSELLPHDVLGYSQILASCYVQLGQKEKALAICEQMARSYLTEMQWYLSMDDMHLALLKEEMKTAITYLYKGVFPVMEDAGMDEETYKSMISVFEDMYVKFSNRV